MSWVNYALVYLGAALMVFNIIGFVRFARFIKAQKSWNQGDAILYVPIALLVLFLLGYLAVAMFGQPDLIMAGILFGGSIFVFLMYRYLSGITRRIIESERLEAKLMAAEESVKAKNSFLANISHEMHTPLNVILGMNGIALKDSSLSPDTRDRLEKVNLSAQHLRELIDNMLDMNRIEAGTLATKSEEFSLPKALEQIDVIASAQCEAKGLTYEAVLPKWESDIFVGDEIELKRVLLSVLDNAVKYTDAPGTVRFVVEQVSRAGDTATFKFSVSDTGIGMDEDFIPKMFDTFSREDASTTDRFGGNGLSMAIAKNVIELMGGTIEAESKKNVGSTFHIIAPLGCVEAEAATVAEPSESQPLETLEGVRVLIVEDIPENAEIVADLLELEGVETEHAENGQIALDMVGQSPVGYYDAILMDLRMPVMDGLEATRRIRAAGRADSADVPIIALTANAFEEDVRRSLDAGMNVHLAKPTDADLLYDTLKQQIGIAHDEERGKAE